MVPNNVVIICEILVYFLYYSCLALRFVACVGSVGDLSLFVLSELFGFDK